MAASHRIIRYRKIRKRSSPRVRYTKADAGGERRRVLSRGCRILSAEAVRLIRVQAAAAQHQSQGKIKPSRSPAGVRVKPDAVDLVTAIKSQAGHRAAAETTARAAKVPRVGELAAAVVALRPRSLGEGRAGCARATSITSVIAPNRSARGVAREATTSPSADRWRTR